MGVEFSKINEKIAGTNAAVMTENKYTNDASVVKNPYTNTMESAAQERKLLAVFLSLMLLGSTFNLGVISILSYAYAIESSAMENIDIYATTSIEFEELIDTSKITSFEIESMGNSWPLEYAEEGIDTSGSSSDTNSIETFEEPVLTKVDLSEEPDDSLDALRSLLSESNDLGKLIVSWKRLMALSNIPHAYALEEPVWMSSISKLSRSSSDTNMESEQVPDSEAEGIDKSTNSIDASSISSLEAYDIDASRIITFLEGIGKTFSKLLTIGITPDAYGEQATLGSLTHGINILSLTLQVISPLFNPFIVSIMPKIYLESTDATSSSSETNSTDTSSDSSSSDTSSSNETSSSDTSSTSSTSGTDTPSGSSPSNSSDTPVVNVELQHGPIEINKPVTWIQSVDLNQTENVAIEVPADAEIMEVVADGENVDPTQIQTTEAVPDESVVVPLDDPDLQEGASTEMLVINEPAQEYDVMYQTPAPYVVEEEQYTEDLYQKNVTVAHDSALHYTNVKSYSDIPEDLVARGVEFKLYWIIDGIKTDVTTDPRFAVEFVDTDGNGIADQMQWIVPQLSEQIFVIEAQITIINVQSYPLVGGEWVVRFTTIGTADLIITGVNGTTFGESEPDDLKFLELNDGTQTLEVEIVGNSIIYRNYFSNAEGFERSLVLTAGEHHLEFRFGNDVQYAHNDARASTTTVSLSPTTVVVSQSTTVNVTVTGPNSAHEPNGTVSFTTNSSGSFSSPSCTLPTSNAASKSCSVTYTPSVSGTHNITASFPGTTGTSHNLTSSTGSANLTVNKRATTTTISFSADPIVVNQLSLIHI